MKKFGIGKRVSRTEDIRFLRGKGQYIDDIAPKRAKHVVFFRSTIAHGKIIHLNTEIAAQSPGIIKIYTEKTIKNKLKNCIDFQVVKNKDGTFGAAPVRPIITGTKINFSGEIIAAIVAETRQQALDALELIEMDVEEISPHIKTCTGGTQIHTQAPNNLAFQWAFGDEKRVNSAFDNARHKIKMDLIDNRVLVNPMETRGCFAEKVMGRLHFCFNGQGVWSARDELIVKLKLNKGDIKVTNPDVGGGFGMKAFTYPEYFIVAMACNDLNLAVKWISDRSEGILSDNAGRDLTTKAEAAFDESHKLIGIRIHSTSNLGAYNSAFGQKIQTELALKVLTGVYDIQTAYFSVDGVFTNTCPVDAYRGAGRPEAIYVIERLIDYSARVLGISGLELRKKNFISKEQFPYMSASGELYDVGDFHKVLARAEHEADIKTFDERKKLSHKNGKLRGLGLCYYIESILGDQNETTKIEFSSQEVVNLYVGTQSNGQGHETVFAQILHERTGIPFNLIRVIQGDSDLIPKGGGTGGSRSVTMQGNSINATADIMIKKFKTLAQELLEATEDEITFVDGDFQVKGTNRFVSLLELGKNSQLSNDTNYFVTEFENIVPGRSYPNGAHFAEIEIDLETGVTQCVKYTVVDDFGFLMNPKLAEGQVHGGVAQGLGQALYEKVVFDDDGQLLTGSFMDYAMPRADNIPEISFHSEPTPSTANAIGMKGCGEAGTVGALAAVTNAALDALWHLGVRKVDMPLTSERVYEYMTKTK